jgi:signal transduction protein with GAF and PtsI domain
VFPDANLLRDLRQRLAARPPDVSGFLKRVMVAFDAQVGTVHWFDASTRRLRLAVQYGLPPELLPVVAEIPAGKGMAGLAVERREPVETCNLQSDTSGDVRPGARLTRMQGSISMPIFRGEEIVGVLGVAKSVEHVFTDEEKQALNAAGGILAEQAPPCILDGSEESFENDPKRE